MRLSEVFPSRYLNKEDLDQTEDTVVTVSNSGHEEVGQERKRKFVIYFKEIKKGLICNKVNLDRMLSAHEVTDTDELDGKPVALYVDHEVTFQGKTIGGIRVRAQAPIPF